MPEKINGNYLNINGLMIFLVQAPSFDDLLLKCLMFLDCCVRSHATNVKLGFRKLKEEFSNISDIL